jgi:hypothetical protein
MLIQQKERVINKLIAGAARRNRTYLPTAFQELTSLDLREGEPATLPMDIEHLRK